MPLHTTGTVRHSFFCKLSRVKLFKHTTSPLSLKIICIIHLLVTKQSLSASGELFQAALGNTIINSLLLLRWHIVFSDVVSSLQEC